MRRRGNKGTAAMAGFPSPAKSLFMAKLNEWHRQPENKSIAPARPKLDVSPWEDLNLAIANGYGHVPQNEMPADWRTVQRKDQPRDRKDAYKKYPPKKRRGPKVALSPSDFIPERRV